MQEGGIYSEKLSDEITSNKNMDLIFSIIFYLDYYFLSILCLFFIIKEIK